MQQKQLLVSQKEIDEHLAQLNLTHDPSLIRSRRQWFFTNKVKIFTMFGKTYQEPPEIKAIEIITHMQTLTSRASELKSILEQCAEVGIELVRDGKEYSSSEKYMNHELVQRANLCLREMREAILWYKKNGLKLKHVKVLDQSFYQYEGYEQ